MKVDIIEYAHFKFPNQSLKDLYWIWLSEKHQTILFSIKNKLVIYNYLEKKWEEIRLDDYICDTEGVEALTTTDNYLVFAGFAGFFEVYELPILKHIKTIETENSGYGAASFKDYVFMNCHEPFGIKMVEIPSGKIIRNFPISSILSDECLLTSISCNQQYLVGYFELLSLSEFKEIDQNNFYYITWNFHTGELISKIPTSMEGFEDPILLKDNMIVNGNKICDIMTSEIQNELSLDEEECILYALDNYIFTTNFPLNEEAPTKINIYDRKDNSHLIDIEYTVEESHAFKNATDSFLILKDDYFYFIPLEGLLTLLK
jgi:hypothetical protein